ncbi:hypothetical protein TL16_g07710 [Triparma laevis f. inornata]|uniref:Uncharacterized protein n=1 Tax=Triparma laevis f. inornata TaxID=1714386 RepID=A0A9W7EIL7_9STRA|nr:hypothetical protein TL16_g07710 [Triparma laevis f. inornata]
MQADLEGMKVEKRRGTAVNSRLRAERNALISELSRLKTSGIRIDDEILEQCINHDIDYEKVYEEEDRDRLNFDANQKRERFDSSWRAREIDQDSTEGQIKSKRRKSKSRKSRSLSRSKKEKSYRHHHSHENLSTTESSLSSESDAGSSEEDKKKKKKHKSKSQSSLKVSDLEQTSNTREQLNTKVKFDIKVPIPAEVPESELKKIRGALAASIEEKKLLSDYVISLRGKIDKQGRSTLMARESEVVLGKVVKQLHSTVHLLNKSAARKRRNELRSMVFNRWSLFAVRNRKAKAVLRRAFKFNELSRNGRIARFKIEVKFRLWRLNTQLVAQNVLKLITKMKKHSGLLKSEENVKKMAAKFKQEAEDAARELKRKVEEEKEEIIRDKEREINEVKKFMLAQRTEFEKQLNSEKQEGEAKLVTQQSLNNMKLEHDRKIQDMQRQVIEMKLQPTATVNTTTTNVTNVTNVFSVLFSPRVIFRSWLKLSQNSHRKSAAIRNVNRSTNKRLKRNYFRKLLLQTSMQTLTNKVNRMRSRTEANIFDLQSNFNFQSEDINNLRTDLALSTISSRIVTSAMTKLSKSYMRAVLKNWHACVNKLRLQKLHAFSRIFLTLAFAGRRRSLMRGFWKLLNSASVGRKTLIRALNSRKTVMLKTDAFRAFQTYAAKRQRAKYLLNKNAWDNVTRSFYKLLYFYDVGIKLKRQAMKRGVAVKKLLNKNRIKLLTGTFRLLIQNSTMCKRILTRAFNNWMLWKVTHTHLKTKLNNIILHKYKSTIKQSYLKWKVYMFRHVKKELTKSTIRIGHQIAANNLLLTHTVMSKRKTVQRWMNMTLGKAFKLWKSRFFDEVKSDKLVQSRQQHFNKFLKQKVFYNWLHYANSYSRGRAVFRRVYMRLMMRDTGRAFRTWVEGTVAVRKHRDGLLIKISRIYKIAKQRSAINMLKEQAADRSTKKATNLLRRQFELDREILFQKHRAEKQNIFKNALARGRICGVVYDCYVKLLRWGFRSVAKYGLGMKYTERIACDFSEKKRNTLLIRTWDHWLATISFRIKAFRVFFRVFKNKYKNMVGEAFGVWAKSTEVDRFRRRQITRVFSKVRHLKLSVGFNTWFHYCNNERLNYIKCVEEMWLRWMAFLIRRSRVKFLVVKLIGSSIKSLARHFFKFWHYVCMRKGDLERFEEDVLKTRTHIAHLRTRSEGLADRFHYHHHKTMKPQSLQKVFTALVEYLQQVKRRHKFIKHYIKKRGWREGRKVLVIWRKVTEERVYGKRFLCNMLKRHYKGTLVIVLEKWRDMVEHFKKVQVISEKNTETRARVRLESAFLGFHASLKQGRKGKRVGKILLRTAKKLVTKSWYTWRASTMRMRLISKSASEMQQQITTKVTSSSFQAWKNSIARTRNRNSSLDMAVSIGNRGNYRLHFFKWLKEARYLRVVANCEQKDWVLLQRVFFHMRVYKDKIAVSERSAMLGLSNMASRKMKGFAFRDWHRRALNMTKKIVTLQRVILKCAKATTTAAFLLWARMLQQDIVTKLRTASEMNMNRLRSDSSLEMVKVEKRYNDLKREAGIVLMMLSLKNVSSNLTTIFLGWKRFKTQVLKGKALEARKKMLLSRVKLSQKRRAWAKFGAVVREIRLSERDEKTLTIIWRVMKLHSFRRGWRGFVVNLERWRIWKAKKDIEKCRAMSVFCRLGFVNDVMDGQLVTAWRRWAMWAKGASTLEGIAAKIDAERKVWEEKLTLEKERGEGLLKAKEQELTNLKALALPYLSRRQSSSGVKTDSFSRRGSISMGMSLSRRGSTTASVTSTSTEKQRKKEEKEKKKKEEQARREQEELERKRKEEERKRLEQSQEEEKTQSQIADATAAAAAEAERKRLEQLKRQGESSDSDSDDDSKSFSTLLSASSGQLTLASAEVVARTNLVLSSLDMLTHHVFALIEEFAIRSQPHHHNTTNPMSNLMETVGWCARAIDNSAGDFMHEIGIEGFWEGGVHGGLWLKQINGDEETLTCGEHTANGDSLLTQFITHGAKEVQTHNLPCYGYNASVDLLGWVGTTGTGITRGGVDHQPGNQGGAFFGDRSLPEKQGKMLMMLLPVSVSGNVVGCIRVIKSISKKMVFDDQEGGDGEDEGEPEFTAIEESLFYVLSLLVGEGLGKLRSGEKAKEEKVKEMKKLMEGVREEARVEGEGVVEKKMKEEIGVVEAERDRMLQVFGGVVGKTDLGLLQGGLEVDKCVDYYKKKVEAEAMEKATLIGGGAATPVKKNEALESSMTLELLKTVLGSSMGGGGGVGGRTTDVGIKVERLEHQLWSVSHEKDRLAQLVSKLGTERAIYAGYNTDYRSSIQKLTEDLGTLSSYSKVLEAKVEKYRKEKRRAMRQVELLTEWKMEGEIFAEKLDDLEADINEV